MANRNKLEILSSILSICKSDGASKTKIVYQANFDFKNAGIYLEWLANRGYLIEKSRIYKTTPSGQALLDNLRDASSTTDSELNGTWVAPPRIPHLSRV